MKSLINIALIALFSLFVLSCNDNSVDPSAQLYSLEDIKIRPGFNWIELEMDKYNPDPLKIEEIHSNYDVNTNKIYMFGKPSCTCSGDHNQLAYFLKILEEADIPESNFEIYSMGSVSDDYPFVDDFQIKRLPEFFVEKNGTFYSIIDEKVSISDSASLEQAFLNIILK